MKYGIISQRVETIKDYGEIRDALDEKWFELFETMGAVIQPAPNNCFMLSNILEKTSPDFIVLSGGNSPIEYGGNAPQRDFVDEYLITYAADNNIPLLGVCRGMQSLAIHFGGQLIPVDGHVATKHAIYGEISRIVNSYHNYAIEEKNNEISVIATSQDGHIEAIEINSFKFMHGIMWHPERDVPFCQEDFDLIKKWLKL